MSTHHSFDFKGQYRIGWEYADLPINQALELAAIEPEQARTLGGLDRDEVLFRAGQLYTQVNMTLPGIKRPIKVAVIFLPTAAISAVVPTPPLTSQGQGQERAVGYCYQLVKVFDPRAVQLTIRPKLGECLAVAGPPQEPGGFMMPKYIIDGADQVTEVIGLKTLKKQADKPDEESAIWLVRSTLHPQPTAITKLARPLTGNSKSYWLIVSL